jgi:hypothetical protein
MEPEDSETPNRDPNTKPFFTLAETTLTQQRVTIKYESRDISTTEITNVIDNVSIKAKEF